MKTVSAQLQQVCCCQYCSRVSVLPAFGSRSFDHSVLWNKFVGIVFHSGMWAAADPAWCGFQNRSCALVGLIILLSMLSHPPALLKFSFSPSESLKSPVCKDLHAAVSTLVHLQRLGVVLETPRLRWIDIGQYHFCGS
jgi:hypothetical protein